MTKEQADALIKIVVDNVNVVNKGIKVLASEEAQKTIEKLIAENPAVNGKAIVEFGAEMYNTGAREALLNVLRGAAIGLAIFGVGRWGYNKIQNNKAKKAIENEK